MDVPTLLVIFIAGFPIVMVGGTILGLLPAWLRATRSGYPISLGYIIAMKLRRASPAVIVDAYITMRDGDIRVSLDELQAHYLSGGRLPRVVSAAINAREQGVVVAFPVLAACDLAGYDLDSIDPQEFVRASGGSAD